MGNTNYKVNFESKDGGLSFAIMIALYVFITFLGQSVLQTFATPKSVLSLAISSLFSAVAMALVIIYYIVSKGAKIRNTLMLNKFSAFNLLPIVALSAGMFLGLGFVNDALSNALKNAGLNVSALSVPLDSVANLLIFILVLAVIPAIIEELFFRGLMLTCLDKASVVAKVSIVSICFAIYHCSASQLIYQLIYGAGLTVLALYSRSVIPGIIAHFLNNFAVIMLQYFNVFIDLYSVTLILCGLMFLAVFAFVSIKGILKEKQVQGEKVAKKFFLPYGAFGVLICLAILLSNLLVV